MSQARAQLLDARVGRLAAARALEPERRRHDADCQRAEIAGDPRHDRCGAGSGAATLAGGDEDHVRAAQRRPHLVVRLLCSLPRRLRIGARAEALRELLADVDLDGRLGEVELLHVRVDGDEIDLSDAGIHHPVDRVQPAAADADDANHREVRRGVAADVQPRGALGHGLDEPARRRLVRRIGLRDGDRSRRCYRRRRIGRRRLDRRLDHGCRLGSRVRRVEIVDVLDRLLERCLVAARLLRWNRRRRARRGLGDQGLLVVSLGRGRQRLVGRLVVTLLALSGLGRTEQLGERALTHARALPRHAAPPSQARGRPRMRRRWDRTPARSCP